MPRLLSKYRSECDNQTVRFSLSFPSTLLALTLATLGCHAQTPAPSGTQLTPAEQHRVEVLLRQKANLPPGSTVQLGPRQPSEIPGYDNIAVSFSAEGKTSKPANFLISKDGKTLAQFSKYDLTADPRTMIAADGRPSRGGPSTAPVVIVGFDDLECPYCARLHESIFPALTQRYGDKVRIVYKDFPLEQHPWAMRAAVDVNCLAAQSPTGYWNLVDYIHAHASDIGADAKDPKAEKTLPRANEQLDKLTREQGQFQKADMPRLEACLTRQDTAAIEASKKIGEGLGLDSTPTLFINGAKIDGAVPVDFLFGQIDDALRAEGVQPPPPYVAPAPPTPATPAATPKPDTTKPTGK
ncbi:MAG TPA: thioredoxin domain-containing protein [Acidobacteriaceae bacterium]|nr:thioredoxin domain-containing protein [Acidobacteriaceae bacterium]